MSNLLVDDLLQEIFRISDVERNSEVNLTEEETKDELFGEESEKLFEEPVVTELPRGLFVSESEIVDVQISEETKELIKSLAEEAKQLLETLQ